MPIQFTFFLPAIWNLVLMLGALAADLIHEVALKLESML